MAILGGGVAGLTAAHELIERGFEVTVYERRALGGKARSIAVPGTETPGRAPLPGEHGFRFFPGFYHNLPDTMRRIAFPENPNGVWDNLVNARQVKLSRQGGPDITVPGPRDLSSITPDDLRESLAAAAREAVELPGSESSYWAGRMLVYLTSSEARRLGQWEKIPWTSFIGADTRSPEYRTLLSRLPTRSLVAAKADLASTRTIGGISEAFFNLTLGRGKDGEADRVLNGPTNEAWIDPWVRQLTDLGVRFAVPATVTGLDMRGGRIATATVADQTGYETPIEADHFICALPAEKARRLWTPEILTIDPGLAAMDNLFVDWMNGIQFYLRRPATLCEGHIAFVDSPWALTALSQNQFWARSLGDHYGDGAVQDCLSVDISDWETPGMLYGKPAKQCNPDEVAREAWAQIGAHVNDTRMLLPDDDLHSWFLDPGIAWHPDPGLNTNDDPLLINTAGSWQDRPNPRTAIANLFLAGDYVRTNVDLATMEGANESARAAVNSLLDATGSNAERCDIHPLYQAPELEPLRGIDEQRYREGLPNVFDIG
ncbi:FAD-dependent oxidoreductase [Nocardia sp. NPDC101769]|uniref:hydroxysqualene dehydroxylase n=1 Tax=Nocardia sp. NPDC101769 TaxID=3364333 RepID=UPI00380ADCD4